MYNVTMALCGQVITYFLCSLHCMTAALRFIISITLCIEWDGRIPFIQARHHGMRCIITQGLSDMYLIFSDIYDIILEPLISAHGKSVFLPILSVKTKAFVI